MGLDKPATLSLYYAALLHDIGLGLTYDMRAHCADGEAMLKKLPLPGDIAGFVRWHHEYADGSGVFGLREADIPKGAQIICLASAFDDLFGKYEDGFSHELYTEVKNWAYEQRARFAEDIMAAFDALTEREYFLLDYFNHETKYALSDKLMVGDDARYGNGDVEKYAHCFAELIDRRSPFTFTHSHGIANLAAKASEYLGYGGEKTRTMYISGLLHDIGKLYVPVEILHKNGKLTREERFIINKHTYFTRKILEQVKGFEEITEYASNHHERLDGTGYPYHLPGERLSEPERVMAVCDVYQALTEERPYRGKLPPEKVWGIIDKMAAEGHLDSALTQRLKEVFG
jgi:putative nucleotidyltransferase with HDIG domain